MRRVFGLILFFAGLFLLIDSNITGAVVGAGSSGFSLVGLIFVLMLVGGLVFAGGEGRLEKITLSSTIKKHKSLLKLTKNAVKDQTVEKELNHLIKELSKGNFGTGKSHPGHIEGTNIFYLRGQRGGRLYYHRIGENSYEIVAKSAKGRNQDKVMNKLRKIYKN